jgi:hypothetical protein
MLSNLEAYNKIVKNVFLAVISSIDDGKLRYVIFVKEYNETREHGGINALIHQQQLEEMSDFTPTKFLSQMNLAENAFSSREELPDWAGQL